MRLKGFTLVETLVAVSVLMLVMVALMSLAYLGISQSITSKERMVALYLAHDAMQYVVNMHQRDIQNGNTNNINTFVSRCSSSFGCRVATNSNNLNSSVTSNGNNTSNPLLRRSGANYRHTGSGTSIYRRAVYTYRDPLATHDVRIRVRVWWTDDTGQIQEIELYRHVLAIGALL